ELVTAAKVRGDLRTVDDVFAGQARDVRTRSTKVLALDDGDALSVSRKRPGSNGRPRAPTEHHQVTCFRLRLRHSLGGWSVLQALHTTCPFRATGSLLPCMDVTRSAADAPASDSPSPTSRTTRSCNEMHARIAARHFMAICHHSRRPSLSALRVGIVPALFPPRHRQPAPSLATA